MFHGLLEVIERFFDSTQRCEIAGDVIEHDGIVRIELERAVQPVLCPFSLPERYQRTGTQVQATGIVGMPLEVPLEYFDRLPRLFDGKRRMPRAPQDLYPQAA